jgi:N-acetylglucosaminyldiphosphoundecaprenol N-acetyl-beta-D-mannosaminyltransferase
MPVVWALRSFGARGQQRVYGPDLMRVLVEQCAASGHRIFLYGGRSESLAALQSRLTAWYPELQIAGAWSPPFRPLTAAEDAAVIEMIRSSRADVIFVGLSTPKQERWMSAHTAQLGGMILIGVGAAFDFHAGRVQQAPGWMQRAGLEWFFRLMMEPARLWKRYLFITPLFLPLWGLQTLRMLRPRSGRP